ncbi:MAG: toxin-antitoxin system YwqK family antitoxin [Opitutales bacterium]|nr:toxin-antitoxin system YwqK family antitoxin [Opitutales bacterium]
MTPCSASPTRRKRFLVACAALPVLAAAAVALYFLFISGPQATETPRTERARAELAQVDGRIAAAESGEAFSGTMVSNYPDGTVRSRSEVVEGRLHGVSEGWHPDGTLETREHFREGVSHGVRERWHPNGQIASRAEIRDGRLHGVFRRWHENGNPAQIIHMQDGVAHGLSLGYFPSGYLQARVELDNGDVVRQEYWEDGSMKESKH